jgi:hypothetical protein
VAVAILLWFLGKSGKELQTEAAKLRELVNMLIKLVI